LKCATALVWPRFPGDPVDIDSFMDICYYGDVGGFRVISYMAHAGGRPRIYKTPEEMQVSVDKYFDKIKENKKPPTVMGLVEACDFEDRQSLINYAGYSKEFLAIVKKAKQKVENYIEERLMLGHNVAGLIFNLKNNFGWVDKQEIDQTIKGDISLTAILSEPKQPKQLEQ